jgi:hypothetical protein
MKRIVCFLVLLCVIFSARAQFPRGSADTLKNYNNRFIDNNSQNAFTNLRLHNLLGGIIDYATFVATGGALNLGMDTAYMANDSLYVYRKNGVFKQFVIRGSGGGAAGGIGQIYRVPFSDGVGHYTNDSNFLFDKSGGANMSRLVIGPTVLSTGGAAKINSTADNMNTLALTAYGTGLNTVLFRRARGTIGTPTPLLLDDDLFNLSGRGYSGSAFTLSRAGIYARATQDWTDTTNGTQLYFGTTSNDSTNMQTRIVVGDSIQIVATSKSTGDSVISGTRNANGLVTLNVVPAIDNAIATGNRTATGDYTQNWNRKQLIIDTATDVRISSYAPDWNFTNNPMSFKLRHYHSIIGSDNPLTLDWSLRNVTNAFDSIGGGLISGAYSTTLTHYTGNESGQISLGDGGLTIGAYGSKTSTISAYQGTITLSAPDSTMMKLKPATTADTVVGVVNYGFGLNTLVKVPIAKKDVDVFLFAGQSNMVGQGDSALSPLPIPGKVLQINTGVISDAKDPVGITIGSSATKSHYGSIIPSFGNTYYNRTSRLFCAVPSSVNGTSQTVAGDVGNGNWDTTGVLFDSAVARVNSAMSVLAAKGYNPIFKGVIWLQGESDAIALEAATITVADYTAAFRKMIKKFRIIYGPTMPFNIIRIGTSNTHPDSYWKSIRDAQQAVANSDSVTQIVYYNAVNFFTRSLMVDNLHFNQVGLNEVGRLTAMAVTSHMKNLWQTQEANIYYPNGNVGIGGNNTSGYGLDILSRNPAGNEGVRIVNGNGGANATSAIRFDTDAGQGALIFLTSIAGGSNIGGSKAFTVGSLQTGGLRLVSNAGGDIVFSKSTQTTTASWARIVAPTGDFLYNTDADSAARGKFQVHSTSVFDSLMRLNNVTAPPSTYNVVVHSTAGDSGLYQVPVSSLLGHTWAQTNNVVVSNTTTETSILSGSGAGSLTILPAEWSVGKTFSVTLYGTVSTDGSNPGTTTFRGKLGSTNICATSGIFQGSGVTDRHCKITITFTCRSTGASGTVFAQGQYTDQNGGINVLNLSNSTATIDTTTNQIFDLTLQWSQAAANNTLSSFVANFTNEN